MAVDDEAGPIESDDSGHSNKRTGGTQTAMTGSDNGQRQQAAPSTEAERRDSETADATLARTGDWQRARS